MKQHQYEVTVKHLADAQGNPSTYTEELQFQMGNHDDIFKILENFKPVSCSIRKAPRHLLLV